ncbi:MAG TPA: glycoside hydrolase domain-containing protein [Bryobacteraceae bacterium]|nr:glycoside hydrolase domain-containing protein [Bryobacteraceae bacterium]
MRKLLTIAALLLSPLHAAPAPAATVWQAFPDYERALPGHPVSAQSAMHLYGARGDYQAFQITLASPSAGITLLDAAASPLRNDERHEIPASSVTLYREHYVHADPASPDRRGSNRSLGAGWYPDALIPFHTKGTYRAAPFEPSQTEPATLWVDVFVPRNAAAGDYHGTVTLSTSQGKTELPFTLSVWDFTVPLKPTLQSSFAFWNPHGRAEVEELLRHKLMPQHGVGKPDASLERNLESSAGLRMSDTGFWSGADVSHCSMKPPPSLPAIFSAVAAHDPGLQLFNYTADEVGNCKSLYPQIEAWGRALHQAHIKNLVVMGPVPELMDAVDIWVLLPMQFDHDASVIAQARAHGNQIWSYNALVQDSFSPKWLIDYDPIDYRIQAGFLSQTYGLTGLLYWRIDRWDGDPWKNVNNQGVFSAGNYPGDGMLVYPGAPAGVQGIVPSIRLNQLRQGVQDYEYVAMLKNLGRGDWALQRIHTVAPDWTNWSRKGSALEDVRRQLGAEIERLSKPQH